MGGRRGHVWKKNQLKRRLNAITIASATCFLFPVAMWDMIIGSTSVELPFSAWAFSSFILFGVILIFYVDSIVEERLNMVFSSPRHLMVAGGCIIVYKMDFSLLGFLLCAAILGLGIHEATSLDRIRKDYVQGLVMRTKFRCQHFQLNVRAALLNFVHMTSRSQHIVHL